MKSTILAHSVTINTEELNRALPSASDEEKLVKDITHSYRGFESKIDHSNEEISCVIARGMIVPSLAA